MVGYCMIISLLVGCTPNNKEIVVTTKDIAESDTKEDVTLIQLGTDYLNLGRYNEAKEVFLKILEKYKDNASKYIEIKDKYIAANRLDDAYFIINLAITNNVDVDNMKNILAEIQNQFEIVTLSDEVLQYESFYLPSKVKVKINNIEEELKVNWEESYVNTNNYGTYEYIGKTEEYNHIVKFTLKIKELVKKTMKIAIDYVYTGEDNKNYVSTLKVKEFLDGDAGKAKVQEITEIVPYYDKEIYDKVALIDTKSKKISYEISENCVFKLPAFLKASYENNFEPYDVMILEDEAIDGRIEYLLGYGYLDNEIYTITLENNIVTSIIYERKTITFRDEYPKKEDES